jgi:hypothetical protein
MLGEKDMEHNLIKFRKIYCLYFNLSFEWWKIRWGWLRSFLAQSLERKSCWKNYKECAHQFILQQYFWK